jgi:hypothetical protein
MVVASAGGFLAEGGGREVKSRRMASANEVSVMV